MSPGVTSLTRMSLEPRAAAASGTSSVLLPLRFFDPLDQHRAELVAPARDVLRGQVQAGDRGLGARDGHPAKLVGQQAANRLHVFRDNGDTEGRLQVGNREAGGD